MGVGESLYRPVVGLCFCFCLDLGDVCRFLDQSSPKVFQLLPIMCKSDSYVLDESFNPEEFVADIKKAKAAVGEATEEDAQHLHRLVLISQVRVKHPNSA